MMRIVSLASLLAVTWTSACGRDAGREGTSRDTAAAKSGMSGMAALSDSGAVTLESHFVTLSAAQIANGRIAWARPVATIAAGTVEVPGQLVPNEDRTARIGAPAQARVLRVHVGPGDRVALHAALVTLQSPDASRAYADVSQAQAEVAARRAGMTYANAARARAERLLELKAIPRQDYERAIADEELARAELAQAESELRRARAAADQLGVDLQTGAMIVRSPIRGVVTARDVAPGAVVSAGTPLVTVTDPATLWLAVSLPEAFASGVRVGSTLRFTVAAYPADTFTARVQSVSAAFDAATRTLPVRGIVANTRGQLRPEMYARVWVPGGPQGSAPVPAVPDSAIQRLDGRSVVFVAHPDGRGGARFERREVELGGASHGRTPVLRGLSATELVVMSGAYAVKAQFAKARMPAAEM